MTPQGARRSTERHDRSWSRGASSLCPTTSIEKNPMNTPIHETEKPLIRLINVSKKVLQCLTLALACAPPAFGADKPIVVGFSQIGAESGWRTANTESIKSEAAKRGIDLKFADAQQKAREPDQGIALVYRPGCGRDSFFARCGDGLGAGDARDQEGGDSRRFKRPSG